MSKNWIKQLHTLPLLHFNRCLTTEYSETTAHFNGKFDADNRMYVSQPKCTATFRTQCFLFAYPSNYAVPVTCSIILITNSDLTEHISATLRTYGNCRSVTFRTTHYAFNYQLLLHMSATHLLSPRSRFLVEKLTSLQLVKKFLAFHGTQMFIIAFTSARTLSQSRASPI
jgi:hypothetical protein